MMNSPTTRTLIERMCATTAGNIGLSAGKLKTVQLSFPPLAEQKRIVAKVDELMALCDRLEAQQQEVSKRQDQFDARLLKLAELLDRMDDHVQSIGQYMHDHSIKIGYRKPR